MLLCRSLCLPFIASLVFGCVLLIPLLYVYVQHRAPTPAVHWAFRDRVGHSKADSDRENTSAVHKRHIDVDQNAIDEHQQSLRREQESLLNGLFPEQDSDPVRRAIAQTLLVPEHVISARKQQSLSSSGEGTLRPLVVLMMSSLCVPFLTTLKTGGATLVEAGCPVKFYKFL